MTSLGQDMRRLQPRKGRNHAIAVAFSPTNDVECEPHRTPTANVTELRECLFPQYPGGGFATVRRFLPSQANELSYRWHDNYLRNRASFPEDITPSNVSCYRTLHDFGAVAVACSGRDEMYQAGHRGGPPGSAQPTLTLKTERWHSPGAGKRDIKATVNYTLPLPSSGWRMQVESCPGWTTTEICIGGTRSAAVNPALTVRHLGARNFIRAVRAAREHRRHSHG